MGRIFDLMLKRCLLAIATLFLLFGGAFAQESGSRVEVPDPTRFLAADSVAILVCRANSEDPGFRQLLSTALAGTKGAGMGSLAGLINTFLSTRTQETLVRSALPFQWVRVDRLGPDGQLHSCIAITTSGWRGLQGLVYQSLIAAPKDSPLKVERHRNQDIVLRKGWQNPRMNMVLTRVKGTFLNCSTPELARQMVDRMMSAQPAASGPIAAAYRRLDRSADSYGVILNRDGSLLKTLRWVNDGDTARVEQKVGAERMNKALRAVTSATFKADVVSDDRIDIEVNFNTTSAAEAQNLTSVLEDAREVLETRRRMGDFHMTMLPEGNGVQVGFTMIGFREPVSRYLKTVNF